MRSALQTTTKRATETTIKTIERLAPRAEAFVPERARSQLTRLDPWLRRKRVEGQVAGGDTTTGLDPARLT